ncbi:MAG: hypothetical protein HYT72_04725 [Candidatus Aenigmarchaeota archaeon]|nr:hypothetical protein [Candidatus Aenigmarchaeota archaeon]
MASGLRAFNWGLIYFTQGDYPMAPSPPRLVRTPTSTVVAFENERRVWRFPEDRGKHSYQTIVPGEYVAWSGPSHRADELGEYALGPDGLGSRILGVRPVQKDKRTEVREALKRSGFNGRVYFWK